MTVEVRAWTAEEPGARMREVSRSETAGDGEVLVAVAGCGVCHTDLGFHFEGVPTRHPYPLTLGHEVSGRVVETGAGAEAWADATVIVPAVIPCGRCPACQAGRGSICPKQIFPGNDVHGGFATHVRVPAHGLCRVPDLADPDVNPHGVDLPSLSVLADAVTTAWQAILRAGVGAGDVSIFVGAGGVGGFGVQLAKAVGAHTVALDVDADKLALLADHGADLPLRVDELDFKELRKRVRAFAAEHGTPSWRRFVFETSGTAVGQGTAFGLVEPGGYLSIVGFTPEKVTIRLSNVMAFDATVQGNWGCLPEHYPAVLDLVLAGKVALAPFTESRPLSTINETFEDIKAHRVKRRIVLVPES